MMPSMSTRVNRLLQHAIDPYVYRYTIRGGALPGSEGWLHRVLRIDRPLMLSTHCVPLDTLNRGYITPWYLVI